MKTRRASIKDTLKEMCGQHVAVDFAGVARKALVVKGRVDYKKAMELSGRRSSTRMVSKPAAASLRKGGASSRGLRCSKGSARRDQGGSCCAEAQPALVGLTGEFSIFNPVGMRIPEGR